MTGNISEGFWQTLDKPHSHHLPFPTPSVDPWFLLNKDVIVDSWKANIPGDQFQTLSYMGVSTCRICGCVNGYKEYIGRGFVFPSGYLHYIEEHDVRPSDQFIDQVLAIIR